MGRAVLTFPVGFEPGRSWPILIVTSTSDFNRTSPMDAEWYRRPALAEGWVLLATDATIRPRVDSTQWRLRDPDSSARINAQGMAAVGQMAGRIRRLLLEAMLAKIASINSCEFLSVRGASAFKKSEKNLASPLNLQ
jgi:hypothetical protein